MKTKDGTKIPGAENEGHDAPIEPATSDPKLNDPMKTPGSGMFPDEKNDEAPSG